MQFRRKYHEAGTKFKYIETEILVQFKWIDMTDLIRIVFAQKFRSTPPFVS